MGVLGVAGAWRCGESGSGGVTRWGLEIWGEWVGFIRGARLSYVGLRLDGRVFSR